MPGTVNRGLPISGGHLGAERPRSTARAVRRRYRSHCLGINNHGQVVGELGRLRQHHTATLCSTAPRRSLGARRNADRPRIFGWSLLGCLRHQRSRRCLWNIRHCGRFSSPFPVDTGIPQTLQLNPPDGFPVAVNACCKTINDRREIVGFMFNADFTQRTLSCGRTA